MSSIRIDAHQHFWRYRATDYAWIGAGMEILAQDYLPAVLAPELARQSIDVSIAVQARAGREETDFLLTLARDAAQVAGVVGWVDLGSPALADEVAAWETDKLLGFRHQIQDEADVAGFVAQGAFQRGLSWLQVHGYSYDVLVYQHQLADVYALCAQHDAHWLILDHLGKPALAEFDADPRRFTQWRDELHRLGALPHVACKLSGLVTEADWRGGLRSQDFAHIEACLDVALEVFGAERLMFGSDWPVCLLAGSYARVAALVEHWAAHLSGAERARIWGETARQCYGLSV